MQQIEPYFSVEEIRVTLKYQRKQTIDGVKKDKSLRLLLKFKQSEVDEWFMRGGAVDERVNQGKRKDV